jgi:enhancer of mRNA-decapping protein 4
MSEGYGATALPTASAGSPVRVYVDAGQLMQSAAQQPQASQLAVFEAAAYEDCIAGKRIDINQHLVVYVVKNGLIRVLHRHTPMKSLLRAHKDQRVTDIQFFQDGDVLATVGGPTLEQRQSGAAATSTVVVWRVFERSPEITSEMLLEIRSTKFWISRVIWHPFNPNQFWMIHENDQGRAVATLVDTTKITTQRHPTGSHPVCDCADFLVTPNAIQVKSSTGDLTDLCWNTRDSRHVLTTHSSGEIILWDTSQVSPDPANGSLVPQRLVTVMDTAAVSRAFFLPHEHVTSASGAGSPPASAECWTTCFATGSQDNRVITLWSPFGVDGSAPQRAQVIELQQAPSSCLVDVVFGQAPPNAAAPSSFIVVSDRSQGNVWAFHCRAAWDQSGPQQRCLLTGADYVVPFKTLYPIYSWSVVVSPTTDITEEELQEQGGLIFDTKIYAYQSKVVQCLTLTSYMCLPPESTWTDPTPGVTVERMFPVHSAHISEVGSDVGFDDALQYDEEYDLGDDDLDDGGEDDFATAPDPSSLPPPPGIVTNGAGPTGLLGGNLMSGNSFSNWLGAIAGAPPAAPIPAEPTAPPASSLPKPMPVPPTPSPLLSPAELATPPALATKPVTSSNPKKSNKSKDKKAPTPKAPSSEGIKILKREAETPTYPPAPLPPAPVPQLPISTSVPVPQLPTATAGMDDSGVRQIVRQELRSLVPELSLAIQKALVPSLQRSIQTSSSSSASLDQKALVSGVIDSLEDPLRDAFAQNMKAVLIPCMESITGQVLSQVSKSLDTLDANSKKAESKELQVMASQLTKLTSMIEQMSQEIQVLRSSVANQQQQQANVGVQSAPVPVKTDAEMLKAEIKALLDERKYEDAFTTAVSASTVDITVFCCANADVSEVFGENEIQLSQPILICVMQQLGTVIGSAKSDLEVELLWLQDIALSLDAEDKRIHLHVPKVLEQLESLINARMARGDVALKRPLQRLLSIIRGIRA